MSVILIQNEKLLNLKYKKLLYYFNKGNYVEVLNVINDNKIEIMALNNNIKPITLDAIECICLFLLGYKETFLTELLDVISIDDESLINLPDDQKELVSIVLLMAVYYLVFDNINDANLLPKDVLDQCAFIQKKFDIINSKSELVTVLSDVISGTINKVNKSLMLKDIEFIKDYFDSYINILYSKLYNYYYN